MCVKRLELIDKGNSQTLLTVAADRITIKFKEGMAADEKQRAQTFLSKVAEALGDESSTLRGTLQTETFWIRMKGGHHSAPVSKVFREEDFA